MILEDLQHSKLVPQRIGTVSGHMKCGIQLEMECVNETPGSRMSVFALDSSSLGSK